MHVRETVKGKKVEEIHRVRWYKPRGQCGVHLASPHTLSNPSFRVLLVFLFTGNRLFNHTRFYTTTFTFH